MGGDGSGPLLRGLAQVLGLDLAGDDGHDEFDLFCTNIYSFSCCFISIFVFRE